MKSYVANIVSQQMAIQADSIEEAEAIYDMYWDSENCPKHEKWFEECGCAELSEDVYHDMAEL
jgi:hypothetical protein